MSAFEAIPAAAVGMKLYRIVGEDLRACEAVRLLKGRPGVIRALIAANISGRVEFEGEIEDHFVDILNDNQDLIATVALDRKSYRSLKTRWLKCKLEPAHD